MSHRDPGMYRMCIHGWLWGLPSGLRMQKHQNELIKFG